MIWELALKAALCMKHIFSIIMELGLGLPTGTIAFWGTHVLQILKSDYTFNIAAVYMVYITQCVINDSSEIGGHTSLV